MQMKTGGNVIWFELKTPRNNFGVIGMGLNVQIPICALRPLHQTTFGPPPHEWGGENWLTAQIPIMV